MQQPQPSPAAPNRPRGILAFLPPTVEHYPHDVDAWKTKVKGDRERSRKRRRKRLFSEERAPTVSERVTLVDWVCEETCDGRHSSLVSPARTAPSNHVGQGKCVTTIILILFCYDSNQEYSHLVRNRLVRLLMYRDSLRRGSANSDGIPTLDDSHLTCLRCIAASSADRRCTNNRGDTTSFLPVASSSSFLASTGFASVPWSSQVAFLVPNQTPSVSVYWNHRKISSSHEELGLEWNDPEFVLKRWSQGRSALTCSQEVLASVLFPTSCAIL
jgi:hypothetical protein